MKEKFIIQINSIVDVITNSSSELFSISGNKETIEKFIDEFTKIHGVECSGEGGEINVKTLKEYLEESVEDANDGWYDFYNDDDYYDYEALESYEEKYNFILERLIKSLKEEDIILNPKDIDSMVVINIDKANQKLIFELRNTFSNYINFY